tara:strand:- start:26193 stop:26669 length:477 start_codon:yes stop_codon:yes gene_type:complete
MVCGKIKNQFKAPISLSIRQDVYKKSDKFLASQPQGKWILSIVKDEGKRRLSCNNQIHLWFDQIAKYHGDRTALEVKNFCKDAFGLPLILNSVKHGDKMEFLLDKLEYYQHSHESKMKLIQCLEVTSLLTVPESKVLMDNLIYYYNDLGIPIKFKDKE